MRRIFPLFLVLLLVLRGLLGDAMAMGEMAAAPSPSWAVALHGHGADPQASHHTAQAAPAAHGDTASHAASHAGEGCAACGICHSAVSPAASLARAVEAAAGIRPAGLSACFVSALPLQAVKPPIS
jgi:hypothetical protein